MQSATRLAYAGDETERSGLRRDAASARALLDELERSVGTSPLERDVSAQAGEELMRLGRAMIARADRLVAGCDPASSARLRSA
jgi:hypothetical protein